MKSLIFKVGILAGIKKLLTGSERTVIVKKNIIGSFVVKGFSILTSIILVPLTINILNNEKYGIWITIFSIVTWFNMMDIGLGNGFRNKFTEAIAVNNKDLAKKYLQTLYSSMTLIASGLLLLYFAIIPFLNWHRILNLPLNFNENINLIMGVVFVLFCGQLILKNISTILLSLQKTTLSNLVISGGNFLSLILFLIFKKYFHGNLLPVSIIFMASPIIILSLATTIAFKNHLREYKPALFVIPNKMYFNNLISLGVKYFVIQITTIVMFSSSSIIITQLYGPSEVTPYNVTYQLFAVTLTIFSIILTPFWAAFSEAFAKDDYSWIKRSIKNLIILWSFFSIGILLLLLISPFVLKFWLGNKIVVPSQLLLQFALYSILMTWTSIFSSFLAGIGKISVSLYGSIFQCTFNIPLAIFLAVNMNLNTTGIIMAININMLIAAILLAWQSNKIINKKAYGIWNR